jgi:hypothetical protein
MWRNTAKKVANITYISNGELGCPEKPGVSGYLGKYGKFEEK